MGCRGRKREGERVGGGDRWREGRQRESGEKESKGCKEGSGFSLAAFRYLGAPVILLTLVL